MLCGNWACQRSLGGQQSAPRFTGLGLRETPAGADEGMVIVDNEMAQVTTPAAGGAAWAGPQAGPPAGGMA
jgi:hypothetical protein